MKALSGQTLAAETSQKADPLQVQSGSLSDLQDIEGMTVNEFLQKVALGKMELSNLKNSDLLHLQQLLTPRMNKFIPHTPTPKQAAFLLLNCKEAFYGGSAGGGKSDALLMAGLQYVDIKGYAGIIFRKSYADLSKPGALIDRAREWLYRFDSEVRWNDKEKRFEFFQRYGKHREIISLLQFGYLENANDKYRYQGGEYQYVAFDELTHIDIDSYKYMFSRLRRLRGASMPLRVRAASNPPDDDGGLWVKKRFIDEGPEKGRVFIPAGMDDNPYLDVQSYEEALNELDPVTRRRLRDGDWEIVRKGNLFKRNMFQAVTELPSARRRCRWWDMAASDAEKAKKRNKSHEPDYTVGFLLSEHQGIFYIEDIIREQMAPAETEELQKRTAISDGYDVAIREETEPGSSGIAVTDNKSRTMFKGRNYDGVRSTGSKTSRALASSAAAGRGQIKYLAGCRNIEEFFNEAESFPGGLHDDMIDGLSGAFTYLGVTPEAGIPIFMEKDEAQGSLWISDEDLQGGYFNSLQGGRGGFNGWLT